MDRVNEVTRNCFDAVVQVRRAEPSMLPPAEMLHHRMKGYVEELLRKAADMGFSHQDAQDLAYPLVALIDEVALTKGEAIRLFWQSNLLQMSFFNENIAGENFFTRLQGLRSENHRHEVIRVYYLCLVLGFQGRYRVRGGDLELMTMIDSIQKELARTRVYNAETLSPQGERPEEALMSSRRVGPLLFLSGGAVALALLIYGILFITLNLTVSGVRNEIEKVGATQVGGTR